MRKFITFEGTEGVGKTTQIKLLQEYLQSKNINSIATREPGGTKIGEKIRKLLLDDDENINPDTELLLMFAARAQHLHELVFPNLKNGIWVICDRFTDASYAYQGGGRGLQRSKISELQKVVQGEFKPDLTVLLNCDIKLGMQRVMERGKKDRFEKEKIEFFERVQKIYLEIAKDEPDRVKIVNAEQSELEIALEIQAIVNNLLSD